MKSENRKFEISFALYWASVALFGIYFSTVAVDALPLRLLDPEWILRVCSSLRGGISYPIVALVLILLGAYLDDPDSAKSYLPRVSWCSFWVALGFFLMIPLQTWASIAVLNRVAAQEQQQLGVFTRGLERIRLSLTEEQLSSAIGSIPGAPSFKPGTLSVPLPQARLMLIQQIEPQLRLRKNQLKAVSSQRLQGALPHIFRDALVAMFATLSFAAVGRNNPDGPTLLERILFPGMNHFGTVDPHVQMLHEVEETKLVNEAGEPLEVLEPGEMPERPLAAPDEDFHPEEHYP